MIRRKAFTLVELLVVIAIIALLMSILMPALRRVREQGRMIKCQANLRQWGIISAIYTEENNGEFWASAGNTPCYWWIRFIEDRYKDWKTNKLWFCPSATKPEWDERGVRSGVLNIFNAWGIYTGGSLGPNGIAGSYGINGYVLIPYPNSSGAIRTQYEGGVPMQDGWKTTGASGANNVPLFTEALRFDLWPKPDQRPANNELAAWSGNNMARCCINRHQGFVDTLFLDFSTRKVGLKELYTLKWHRSFNITDKYTLAGGVQASDWPEWIRPFPDY